MLHPVADEYSKTNDILKIIHFDTESAWSRKIQSIEFSKSDSQGICLIQFSISEGENKQRNIVLNLVCCI